MAQARIVSDAVCARWKEIDTKLVPIVTTGDRTKGSLGLVGGKGLFTRDLESALLEGRVDLAVHSAKDLPVSMSDRFVIPAIPPRADPRDALVSRSGFGIAELPRGAVVATSSPRRKALLLSARSDLQVVEIRGNVETRVRKVLNAPEGGIDAVVLAMAGLNRSGLSLSHGSHICPLSIEQFVPAAGGGALVVQCSGSDAEVIGLLAALDDPRAHQEVLGERAVLRGVSASCHSCIAAHITSSFSASGGGWKGLGMAAQSDGQRMVRIEVTGRTPAEVSEELLEKMRQKKVDHLIRH